MVIDNDFYLRSVFVRDFEFGLFKFVVGLLSVNIL